MTSRHTPPPSFLAGAKKAAKTAAPKRGGRLPDALARPADDASFGALGTTAKSSAAFGPENGLKPEKNQPFSPLSERDELCPNFSQIVPNDNDEDFLLRSGTVIDSETGEIQEFVIDPRSHRLVQVRTDADIKDEARFTRYALQDAARNVLKGQTNPKGKPWRTVDCLRAITGSEVGVMYAPAVARAHYSGLATCGSVWNCPVCSTKITERRKAELEQAANLHIAAGGAMYMVTLTWAHTRHDDLDSMVKGSRQALTKLRGRRAYVKMLKAIDYVGLVRNFELKHSDLNGWHPHFHELWFVARRLTARQLEEWKRVLFDAWRTQCLAAGLGEPNRTVGLTIVEAASPAEYMAKFGHMPRWGVGAEMTRSHAKKGNSESRTPWDLLRLYAEGQTRFLHLFREYAAAFFGSAQLYWSPGLKQLFGIDEISDEALAEREDEKAYQICRISAADWRLVLRQPYESRALILKLAESGGADAVSYFLDSIRK